MKKALIIFLSVIFSIGVALLYIKKGKSSKPDKNISDSLFVDYEKPSCKVFNVDDVDEPDNLLNVSPIKDIIENKTEEKIMFFPEEQKNFGLVDCMDNGLIATIHTCYDQHRPLLLSPDAIWLTICQSVSIHINKHFEQYKGKLLKNGEPIILRFRDDSLEYKSKSWVNIINLLSKQTQEYTKSDYYSFFVPKFSTTDNIRTVAYQITMLECFRKAFVYIADSGCGIPNISLSGEKKDWETILHQLNKLDELGLSEWAENIRPLIQEFINVYDGKIDKEFWQRIYKTASEYSATYISGWIIKFFPYLKSAGESAEANDRKDVSVYKEETKPNPFWQGEKYLLSNLQTSDFPSGIAKIDIIWNNFFKDQTKVIQAFAGFFAIKQYKDRTLEPFISWAICDKSEKIAPKTNRDSLNNLNAQKGDQLTHKEGEWHPKICEKLYDSAIYNSKKFKNQYESLRYIQLNLLDSLGRSADFKDFDLKQDSIAFVVLSNGKIENISLARRRTESKLLEYLSKQLKNLPERWQPAIGKAGDIFEFIGDVEDKELNRKIKVNSLVKISLSKK